MTLPSPSADRSAFLPLLKAQHAANQPHAIFGAMEQFCRDRFGFQLLTILRNMPDTAEIERVYSSDREKFPLLGRKPMGNTPWGQIVLDQQRTWLGNGAADINWAFPDARHILSFDLEASLSVPIVWSGTTLGVLSLADRIDRYNGMTTAELEIAGAFLIPALVNGNG